jgi:hypothetical protein
MLLAFITFFSQCKKNNPPAPPQKNSEISPGYYIIRTKYMCGDGRAFVLGSFSNHEVLSWYRASPAELKSIKEDGAFESNTFIWKVGESIIHGPGIAGIPPPANIGSMYIFHLL